MLVLLSLLTDEDIEAQGQKLAHSPTWPRTANTRVQSLNSKFHNHSAALQSGLLLIIPKKNFQIMFCNSTWEDDASVEQ